MAYDGAMMTGYALTADRGVVALDTIDAATGTVGKPDSFSWVDFEGEAIDGLAALGEALGISDEAIEDCLTGEQRPRIDDYDAYGVIVVYGAVGPEEFASFEPRKLSILFAPQYVVTVHQEALRTTRSLMKRCAKRPKTFLGKGTDQLLFSILDGLVDNYRVVSQAYADRLEGLEERSLERDADEELLGDMSALRKELLELRRIALAQRELIISIASGQLDYVSDELQRDFRHVRDHLTTVVETIDSSRELLHGIRDNYHASMANRMNEIMKVLTIFATLFMPPTFLAGIYGMNTPLWPNPESMGTFVGVVTLMAIGVTTMLTIFKYRGWF